MSDLLKKIPTDFDLAILDRIADEEVSVKCVNSSDFVVGRQTNFNAPVTIINCENSSPTDGRSPSYLKASAKERREEEIIIKQKVLSESAMISLKQSANGTKKKKKKALTAWLTGHSFKVPNYVWIGFFSTLIGTTIALTFLVIKPEITAKEIIKCQPGSKLKDGSICIFKDWKGRKNTKKVPIDNPVPYVVISETNHDICFDFESCVEAIENFRSSEYENDNYPSHNGTICNFFVGGDGSIYEDAGWNGGNSLPGLAAGKSMEVCLIGNSVDYPTYPQIESAKCLISFGSANNFIAKNYVLMTLNATSTEYNVSSNIYDIVKKWPNFRKFPLLVDEIEIFGENYPIVAKEDWGGLPATSIIEMKLPVPYVVISHSVTAPCFDRNVCSILLQGIQKYHQSLRYADIAYNFMVDSKGVVYEGRGWSRRNVAGGFINGRNLDINFIGDFSRVDIPTADQLNAVKYLIRKGVKSGKIALNYVLISANATFPTLSPGKNVYDIIKEWPHFDPDPQVHLKDF